MCKECKPLNLYPFIPSGGLFGGTPKRVVEAPDAFDPMYAVTPEGIEELRGLGIEVIYRGNETIVNPLPDSVLDELPEASNDT